MGWPPATGPGTLALHQASAQQHGSLAVLVLGLVSTAPAKTLAGAGHTRVSPEAGHTSVTGGWRKPGTLKWTWMWSLSTSTRKNLRPQISQVYFLSPWVSRCLFMLLRQENTWDRAAPGGA